MLGARCLNRQLFLRIRHAFTLVEMLIVLAIISLLAAILLPALQRTVEASKVTMCMNNQRQIALMAGQYLDDNKGYFLSSWGPYSDGDVACAARYWQCYFAPYVDQRLTATGTTKGVTYRTVTKGVGTPFYCPVGTSWLYYGWSDYLGGASIRRMVNPNKTMMLTDGTSQGSTIYIWTGHPNFCHVRATSTCVTFCDQSVKVMPEPVYYNRAILKGSPYRVRD